MPKKTEPAASVVELGSEPRIRDVSDLHRQLMSLASHPEPVLIDAARIDRIDTAVMQAVLAFVTERNNLGLPVNWLGPSERFRAVADGLGLSTALGLGEDDGQ